MNFDEIIAHLQAADGDPDKLVLATLDIALADREPGLRTAMEPAAIPHWFNADILAALLDCDSTTASDSLEALSSLTMVEAFPLRGGWNVHEATRLALRRRLQQQEPERLRVLSAKASACFIGDAPALRIEALFHQLSAGPDADAAEALRLLYKEWEEHGRHESLQALAHMLDEALRYASLGPVSQARALLTRIWIRGDNTPISSREADARESLALFTASGDELGQMHAQRTLGEILVQRRDLVEAGECFLEFSRIATLRAEAKPEDLARQRQLCVSHNLHGDLLMAKGNRTGALAHYRDGLAIIEKLAALDPEYTVCQRDMSLSHDKIGDILTEQGDRNGALAHYQDALAIREKLAVLGPRNTEWQRDVSVSHNKIGNILAVQGDIDGAFAHYRDDLAISEKLAAMDPSHTEWQRDVSISHNKIGDILAPLGDRDGALAHYQDGLAINEKLAALDPSHTEWQRDVSVSHSKIGDILAEQGDREGALAHYRDDLAISEKLAALDPSHTEWQRDVSVSHSRIGDILAAQGDRDGALAHYQASFDIRVRLAALDPSHTQWQRDVSIGHMKLAQSAEAARDNTKALDHYRQALAIAEKLLALDPGHAQWQNDLGWFRQQVKRVEREIAGR